MDLTHAPPVFRNLGQERLSTLGLDNLTNLRLGHGTQTFDSDSLRDGRVRRHRNRTLDDARQVTKISHRYLLRFGNAFVKSIEARFTAAHSGPYIYG